MTKQIDPSIPKAPEDEQNTSSDADVQGIDPAIPKPPKSEEAEN